MTDNILGKSEKRQKRHALRILTPKILKPRPEKTKELISVSGFIRERIIMGTAREAGRRAQRARKLGVPPDQLPLPDPIWKKYINSSVKVEDFDIFGCEKDSNLFELGKEIVEQVNAAEIGPDDGIPINSEITLPRSFLLDSIHLAASQHCIYLQKKPGKPSERTECPSPYERAKPFEGINEYYRTSIKTMTGKMMKNWLKFGASGSGNNILNDNESISSDEDESEPEEAGNVAELAPTARSPSDPDFETILKHLLEIPYSLEPKPPAYEYAESNDFGADALWSFDTTSLLAFGVLAEEFIGRMIDIYLEKGTQDSLENIEEEVKEENLIE